MKKLFQKYLNLHLVLAGTLAVACLMGPGLVLLSDMAYQKLAINQQKQALENLLAVKSNDLINELIHYQKELGFVLQTESSFIDAFQQRDQNKLRFWLDQEFNRYYTTTGLIRLEKLLVYDTGFKLISHSARGVAMGEHGAVPCASLVRSMSQLSITEHLKPRSELCLYDNKPLLSTIVSIGSLQPKGYIQIVSDPAFILANIEDRLGIELKITSYDNIILHQSSNWPADSEENKTVLRSSHVLLSSDSSPLLVLNGATADTQAFFSSLASTRTRTITASVLVTLCLLIIALTILGKLLAPLRHLRSTEIEVDRGDFPTVNEQGFTEISTPIRLFNKAVAHIQALKSDLEHEINTHKQTEEQLNLAIKQAKENALTVENQRNFLRMTLQSVIDGVITTDNSGHVTYINPIAEKLTGWSEQDANGKTLAEIFHAFNAETRERIYDPTESVRNKSVLDEPVSAILIHNDCYVETPVEYIATPMLDSEDNITGNVIIIHDESAQRSLNRQLTFQATHDALTGLLNRFEFERRLKHLIAEAGNSPAPHTLCYMDIDEFKKINDEYGHAAGDELLKQVTLLLEKHSHKEHTLARLGSDEFGLLLENCDIKRAESIVNTILRGVDRFNFIWEMSSTAVNISVGITSICTDEIPCNELLSNAISACRLAKEDGRDRLQIYTPEHNKLLTQQREMHWVSRINHALEENRFRLYYHEILPLQHKAGRFMRHGEALLRMIDKKGEVISPNMFLPAAERYGMLGVIDEWVVDKTIAWLSNEHNNAILSINISGHSISNRKFLNFVVSKIKQTRINPELLCFEVTEATAMRHLSATVHFMTVLKKLGCSFALDDFGSGLSSFSYLTSLPVDYIKIDGTFVVDIDKDPMHYAMVKSINEVGHVMGIKTIAEFAASERIIDCLREIGVDNAQGYAVARPMPLSSLDDHGEYNPNLTVI